MLVEQHSPGVMLGNTKQVLCALQAGMAHTFSSPATDLVSIDPAKHQALIW